MFIRTFLIPESRLTAFTSRVDNLAARAKRLGAPAPTMEVVGWDEVEAQRGSVGAPSAILRTARVEVSLPTRSDFGCTLVATIAHEDAGNVIWTAPGGEAHDLRRYRASAADCEHCGVTRRRGDTFVVLTRHGLRQLGRDCMEVATGISPALVDVVREVSELRAVEDAPVGPGWYHYPATQVLAAAAALIRVRGFQSAANAAGGIGTGAILSRAFDGFRPVPGTPPEVLRIVAGDPPGADDLATANGAHAMALAINPETATDFEANVHAACASHVISVRHIGLAAAAVHTFLRERVATMATVSGHFGAVGDRISDKKPTKKDRDAGVTYHPPMGGVITQVIGLDGMYGTTWIIKITADTGHALVWKSSTPGIDTGRGGSIDCTIGKRVRIESATIKDHAVYRGVPETQITRAKLHTV